MIDADFSQIEYRTLVAMANEPHLKEQFKDPDSDYHTMMASLMYGVPYASVTPKMRGDAKSFNFGIPYGMGFRSLAILLNGDPTPTAIEEAKEKYELYFKEQPNVRRFFVDVKEKARNNQFTETKWHRKRYYSFVDKDGNYSQSKMAMALRQAGNAVIQGCLSGDTKIQTKDYGIVNIEDVVNKHLLVWNGNKWTNGDITYSGKKQKCIIKFTNGQEFICSPIHRFLVFDECDFENPDFKEDGMFVKCKYLKPGNAVKINLDKSKLCIKNFDERLNEVTCYDKSQNYTKRLECAVVESVEITNEYIDMYDVCNTDEGYYVADGIITHNTAADIFKIAVARTYVFIKENNLFGKFFITNMVHDEQLTECNCKELDAQVILKGLVDSMELELEGFPPLFVGAGVGLSWKDAKGKMAEIHPVLATQLLKEAEGKPIFTVKDDETRNERDMLPTSKPQTPVSTVDYFNKRVFEFRVKKVTDYARNEENWNKPLHPVIGNLLSLQFDYGLTKEFEAEYKDNPNHTKEEKEQAQKEIPVKQLAKFFEQYDIDLDPQMFSTEAFEKEQEQDDKEYDDEDDLDDMELMEFERLESDFALIDESDELYGIDIRDIIRQYGLCIDRSKKICGINTANMYYSKKDEMVEYISNHVCEPDDEGAVQVVYLKDNNTLFYTGIFVNGITGSRMSTILKLNALAY